MSSIEERVKKIVVEQLVVKEEEVSNSASFVDDLGADSLDTVELVMALEEEFECEITDEEAEKITSVQQAIDYIRPTSRPDVPGTSPAPAPCPSGGMGHSIHAAGSCQPGPGCGLRSAERHSRGKGG